MKGQKEAVVDMVKQMLPGFIEYKNIALMMLTPEQLEELKREIGAGIYNGEIEYSKADKNGCYQYARAMVMNHLKKARELNGNSVLGKAQAQETAEESALAKVNMDILPEDLKAFVQGLV